MHPQSKRPAGATGEPSEPDLLGKRDRSEDNARRCGDQAKRQPIVVASIPKGDGEVRVTLDEFKGNLTIDVRLFEPFTAAQVPMPTKRGVTLGIRRLPELARALAEAETVARHRGLIE